MAMYALFHFVFGFYPFLSNNVILENPETVFCLILKRMKLPQLNHLCARALEKY